MSCLKRHFLFVARTLPVETAGRARTSQEDEFHHNIRLKLTDAHDRITISDEFLNAIMLNSDDESLLLVKRNAFSLHRLFPRGPGWIMKGGGTAWREKLVQKIQAGLLRTPQDLDAI